MLQRAAIGRQPIGKLFLAALACRTGEHGGHRADFIRRKLVPADAQEHIRGQEGRPLVAVDKRMIAHNAERISRSETEQVRLTTGTKIISATAKQLRANLTY